MAVKWPSNSHNKSMAIDRKNSFHLLLSDDELKLLRLLAEREGLNASDYLRSLLRQMAGASPHLAQVIRLGDVQHDADALDDAELRRRARLARNARAVGT